MEKSGLKRVSFYFGIGVVATLAVLGSMQTAGALFGAPVQPAPQCKISPVDAIKIAQAKVKGKTIQANFEFDEGHWVYGVMIVQGNVIKEVEIDPMSGKIGDVETVTPAGEAKEMETALNSAIGIKSTPVKAEKGEKEEKAEKE